MPNLQLAHLSHDFWHEMTHLDGKIWGTFWTLFFKPGQLTKDYWEGRRGLWVRPIRIFLIVSALSLLLTPDAAGPLGMRVSARQSPKGPQISISTRPGWEHQRSGVTAKTGASIVDVMVDLNEPMNDEQLAQLNGNIHKFYKGIQYLSLALFAAMSMLLSRKLQPFFGAHLILALHFYSVEYVLTGIVSLLKLTPQVSLSGGFFYLAFSLWRLAGNQLTRKTFAGKAWAVFWRTMVLFSFVAIAELLAMSAACGFAMLMRH